ncbi:MAG: hypothetical protein MSA15_21390 [Clostridium sp.]|nr:hypothetical protein [Clostridium sp.]
MENRLSGAQLAGGNSSTKREENDYYATAPETTKLFLDIFKEDLGESILEPACGEGHLAEVLKEYFPNSNIDCIDLINRGYGTGGIDFLTYNTDKKYDTVITNPPFKYAKEFILKGLELSNRYVIMLCKIQLLEGVNRKEMFFNTPLKYIYVHTTRQATWKNGEETDSRGKKWATTMCLAWFVWEKGYNEEPIVRWI